MKKQKRTTTASKIIEARAQGLAQAEMYAARLRRVGHEAGELRVRLEALAFHARRHAPPSIRDHLDLWVLAMEAMSDRARYVAAIAAGDRP